MAWVACKYLHGEKIPGTKGLFDVMEKDIIRTNGWELKLEKFSLNDPQDFNNGGDETLAQSPEEVSVLCLLIASVQARLLFWRTPNIQDLPFYRVKTLSQSEE